MFLKRFVLTVASAMLLCDSAVFAQYYSGGCSSCAPTVAARASVCTPMQPVYSTCYQTVPVTTLQREKQTVKVPYYKTSYREQKVTYHEPVTRQREIEVPTVSYKNVTEYRTVNRDMGRWVTQYNPVTKYSPCQVDPRPGMIGWLNRTGYSFRTAFMPNYTTARQYVPNMMTCRVPHTRQVAVHGTRKVVVHETQMVAKTRVEKVPVQQLAYREETITVMKPQTVYRTVPTGTSLAYGYGGYGGYYGNTATAFAPIIDSNDSPRTALGPTPDPGFSDPNSGQSEPFPADDEEPPRFNNRSETAEDDPNRFVRPSSYDSSSPNSPQPVTNPFPAEIGDPDESIPVFRGSTQNDARSIVIPVSFQRSQVAEQSTASTATASTATASTSAGSTSPAVSPRTAWRARKPGSRSSSISLTPRISLTQNSPE